MNASSNNNNLVLGRECGECTACCVTPAVETSELVKPPNHRCGNLKADGKCAIYASRPTTCQKWFCAWRNMTELDEGWRPDKFGVITEFARENFPPPFTGRIGYHFTILDRQKLAKNRKLAKFIIAQIRNGIPCLLSYGPDADTEPATAFLNLALARSIKSNNINAVIRELVKAMEACAQQPRAKLKTEGGKLVPA